MEGYKKPFITNEELQKAQKEAIADMQQEGINPNDFEGQIMDEKFDAEVLVNDENIDTTPTESNM